MASRQASPGLRLLLLIGVCLTLIAGIPATPTRAGTERNQDIDNSLAEFDDGSFQLTASANYPTGATAVGDTRGASQLAPIAAITGMDPTTSLPAPRIDAGVVALGRNIFAIGGNVSGTGSGTVISSLVDLGTGGLGTWQSEPDLPAVAHSSRTNFTAAVSPRSLPAVAAYASGQDSGFIYVVGGQVSVGGQTISSFSVLRGTVAAGRITTWTTTLPNIPNTVEGLTNASAAVATLPNGRAFLLVFGGLQRYKQPSIPVTESGSRLIFSAELNTTSGDFVGNAWSATTATIPVDPTQGLWGAPVVGGNLRDANGLTVISYYLMGGNTDPAPAAPTSTIYRVDVNTSDGSLTVNQPSGVGSANASTGTPRSGHTAIQFRGSVYVAGGINQGQTTPNRVVSGSYVQPDRRFPDLDPSPGGTVYFINKNTGLPAPRSGHGMVVVPNAATNATKAYVYLIGGSDGITTQATNYVTTIGDPNVTTVSFPYEGYYISKPVPFTQANARLKRIFWGADIPTGAGVQITYRLSDAADCSTLGSKSEIEVPWQPTTPIFNAAADQYEYNIVSEITNCFQYRARLTPNAQSDTNTTPYLKRLGIVIEVPGAIDLTVKTAAVVRNANNVPTGFNITLRNENTLFAGEPTLPADFGLNGPGTALGSFFVDVFIYPPGVTPPATHTIPTVPSTFAALSIDVFRSELQAGPGGIGFDFTIPSNRQLCDYTTRYNPPNTCAVRSMASLFPVAGTYKVVVVVDGNNDVIEQPTGGGAEANNVSLATTVTIAEGEIPTGSGSIIFLPVIKSP